MGTIKTSRGEYSGSLSDRMFGAYSYQAMRARTKVSCGFDRHHPWLWFEQKTFGFRAILKNIGLMKEPSLARKLEYANKQITKEMYSIPSYRTLQTVLVTGNKLREEGELCKQRGTAFVPRLTAS